MSGVEPERPPAMADLQVLLVDDEEDFLTLLAKRLRRRSLQVSCASTAEAALEVLARQRIAVVVLDIRLPGMDGLEALQRIRERYPATQVIMLTGFTDRAVVDEAQARGAFCTLVKPVEVRVLLSRIHQAARGSIPPASPLPKTS